MRGEPLQFEDCKWLLEIYADDADIIDAMKAAQMRLTEWALSESIYWPDQLKVNSIYFMPTSSALSDLVQARLNSAIDSSEYLSSRVGKEATHKLPEKVGLKKCHLGFWYGRGCQNEKQVTSVDGDIIFVDEVDRIEQRILPMLDKRLLASKLAKQRWFGTPTVPEWGIHKRFLEGTQKEWEVECNHCGEWQEMTYADNVDEDILQTVCRHCSKPIKGWELKGRWVERNPEGDHPSYHLTQLYSPTLKIKDLVEAINSGNEWKVTQAYNQMLGLPYEPKGATITLEDLYACRSDYTAPLQPEGGTFVGVDVGRVLHVEIQDEEGRVVGIHEWDWDTLKTYLRTGKVKVLVIDALPELEMVAQLVKEFGGVVFVCYYSNPKLKDGEYFEFKDGRVDANRTASLDASLSLVTNKDLKLPQNLENYPDYIKHFKNIKRVVTVKDEKTGEKEAKWIQIGDDHYAHAHNYCELAKKNVSVFKILG